MDLYCPTCGEPWDNDCLHEEADARSEAKAEMPPGATYTLGTTYPAVAADFRERGCKALITAYGPQPDCTSTDTSTRQQIALVYELLGDDMDGAAVTFEDLGLPRCEHLHQQ